MSRILSCLLGVAIASTVLAGPAHADSPCGDLQFDNGTIRTQAPLPMELPLSAATQACLQEIAKGVLDRPYIRSLTVVARVLDSDRHNSTGMGVADAIRTTLSDAGVPLRQISVVSPTIRQGQQPGISFVFQVRERGRPVAKLKSATGAVHAGRAQAELNAMNAGQLLYTRDYLHTGPAAHAHIELADGSQLDVAEKTILRLGTIKLTGDGHRSVQIELLEGQVETVAAKGDKNSRFEIISRSTIAGVRGTHFRVHTGTSGTMRLETVEGSVSLDNDLGNALVDKGFGSQAQVGQAPEAPRPLLQPAQGMRPIQGSLAPSSALSWQPVVGAVSYRLEFARDALFTREVSSITTPTTSAVPPATQATGAWFWRVLAVDGDGFAGMPSKVYRFAVAAPANAAPTP